VKDDYANYRPTPPEVHAEMRRREALIEREVHKQHALFERHCQICVRALLEANQ
jgi:hypothetical protein